MNDDLHSVLDWLVQKGTIVKDILSCLNFFSAASIQLFLSGIDIFHFY